MSQDIRKMTHDEIEALNKYKLKKPVVIQYASAEEVAAATAEVLKEHAEAIEMLAQYDAGQLDLFE
jgi:hypothetical protein